VAKTFDEYRAEHAKEPFPLPMPDGKPVMLPMASIDEEDAVAEAIAAAREAGQWTRFSGMEVIISTADAARVAEAWGKLPPEAWEAAMADMRAHFGRKN
jgi:hypothetical protein